MDLWYFAGWWGNGHLMHLRVESKLYLPGEIQKSHLNKELGNVVSVVREAVIGVSVTSCCVFSKSQSFHPM